MISPLRRRRSSGEKRITALPAAVATGRARVRGVDAQAAAALLDLATCAAMASISGGERQSYGSSPSSLRRDLIPSISDGSTPDSSTEDTNAAKPGAAEPDSWNSSGWMK